VAPGRQERRIAVIGIGNLLMQDDGLGIHALQSLRDCCDEQDVSWIDGGTDPWGALWQARECRDLIILDAVAGDGPPGTVYRLNMCERLHAGSGGMSLHNVNLLHLIHLEQMRGRRFDSVAVLGIQPARIQPGMELSAPCRTAMSELLRMVLQEISRLEKETKFKEPCHVGH